MVDMAPADALEWRLLRAAVAHGRVHDAISRGDRRWRLSAAERDGIEDGIEIEAAVAVGWVELAGVPRFEIATDLASQDPITDAVWSHGTEIFRHYDVLLGALRAGDRVVDVGAHIGTFAFAAAALGCEVLAIEASPRNAALLRLGVRRNGFTRVHVVHAAATAGPGVVEFLPHGPWGTLDNPTTRTSPDAIQALTIEPVTVPAMGVDDVIDSLGWDRVDVVKLDVEGGEVGAIAGMSRLLAGDPAPMLLYESNAHTLAFFSETPSSLDAALARHGYRGMVVARDRLVAAGRRRFREMCNVDILATKDNSGRASTWPVVDDLTHAEYVDLVVSEGQSPFPVLRRHLADSLRSADRELLSDGRIRDFLGQLVDDPNPTVRTASRWWARERRYQ
jgi:FkbM family methyltransferase